MADFKRVMAVDYGTVRVGIAVSDPTGMLARGLETIQRLGDNRIVIARICELIQEYNVDRLVLGMPKRSDGKPGEKEREVKAFSKELQAACGLRPIYRDERYSTVIAQRIMTENKVKQDRKRQIVDQIAAEIILQSYLDENRPSLL